MTAPDLTIIIVSFNTRDLLLRCLDAVFGSLEGAADAPVSPARHLLPNGYEVLVVDNASSDHSAAAVARYFPEVVLLQNTVNLGFAAANNQAIARSRGRYLLFLNPDTEVAGDAIAELVGFLERTPRAGVVTGRLLHPDGSPQHSAFHFPTLWMVLFDFFPLPSRLLDSSLNGRYPRSAYRHPFTIDHPLGACMLVRRLVVDEVGPYSEEYFMYCEEVDWCLRIKRAGWQIYCQPRAVVVHHGGQSTGQMPDQMYLELQRSRLTLYRRQYPVPFQAAVRLITAVGLWCEYARWAQRLLRGEIPRERFLARRQALIDAARLLLPSARERSPQARTAEGKDGSRIALRSARTRPDLSQSH